MNELLLQGLSELGLDVSRAETLERFSSLLLEKNQVMNLTAITEPDAVAQLHLLDSAALLPFVDLTGKTVVDVGTGAGFPGMPLRILKDDFDLTLLDSLGKRVNWLQEVCDELQLKRVACVHARAEEFAMQHREQFDIATSRAVAQLSILSELCLPLIKVGGQFVAMKSVDTEDEIAAMGVEKREIVVGYEVGDSVKITDGALESFLGTVEELDLERGKVRVMVSMFGRETPVELELDQVEPMDR